MILGRRYNRTKKKQGGDVKSDDAKSKAQNDTLISTAAKLAKEHGVSEATQHEQLAQNELSANQPQLSTAMDKLPIAVPSHPRDFKGPIGPLISKPPKAKQLAQNETVVSKTSAKQFPGHFQNAELWTVSS